MSVTVIKKRLSLQDILQVEHIVPISETEELAVRPLTLSEMLELLTTYTDPFVALWQQSQGQGPMDFTTMIVAAPDMVAHIIAQSASGYQSVEELEQQKKAVKMSMAGPVQLIALEGIWKASVPDPKKLGELLSMAAVQLGKLRSAYAASQQAPPKSGEKAPFEPSAITL